MHCGTCGLLLESVDEKTQVIRHGRFSEPEIYCEQHKPVTFIEA